MSFAFTDLEKLFRTPSFNPVSPQPSVRPMPPLISQTQDNRKPDWQDTTWGAMQVGPATQRLQEFATQPIPKPTWKQGLGAFLGTMGQAFANPGRTDVVGTAQQLMYQPYMMERGNLLAGAQAEANTMRTQAMMEAAMARQDAVEARREADRQRAAWESDRNRVRERETAMRAETEAAKQRRTRETQHFNTIVRNAPPGSNVILVESAAELSAFDPQEHVITPVGDEGRFAVYRRGERVLDDASGRKINEQAPRLESQERQAQTRANATVSAAGINADASMQNTQTRSDTARDIADKNNKTRLELKNKTRRANLFGLDDEPETSEPSANDVTDQIPSRIAGQIAEGQTRTLNSPNGEKISVKKVNGRLIRQ